MVSEISSVKPSYFAVIPAKVRYDPQLRDSAKLLYSEITALANASGYCFACNNYFANLYNKSAKTISELIGQLKKLGYIKVEIIRDAKGEIIERRIYVDTPQIFDPPIPKNREPSPEKSGDTIPKNREENNTSNNNIPPIVPQKRQPASKSKTAPDWKPDRFAGFWSFYPRHVSKQAAIRAWDKLQPSDELIGEMGRALLRMVKSEEWQRGIGIPYASTWLNQQRWTDETDEPAPSKQQSQSESGGSDDSEVLEWIF